MSDLFLKTRKFIHGFLIPVLGTGYTIDTPINVARFGVTSTIPLTDHVLIEKARKYYCTVYNKYYEKLKITDRIGIISSYLNTVNDIVNDQIEKIKSESFDDHLSDLVKYFRLLPDYSELKIKYLKMLGCSDINIKLKLEKELRDSVEPGFVDANIMTKLDNDINKDGSRREIPDAKAALLAYAKSDLNGGIVFSAGLSKSLFALLKEEECKDFQINQDGSIKKSIILKVSDYRSARLQSEYLAKKGIWVSEYRIESGLNCGGHAFATKGFLFGPILQEFKEKRQSLYNNSFELINKFFKKEGKEEIKSDVKLPFFITAQGGFGTGKEQSIVSRYFKLNSTGWGTPFLLVPEATSIDDDTLSALVNAGKDEIKLTEASPMGVLFWSLETSSSREAMKEAASREEYLITPCPNRGLVNNTEFGDIPMCVASHEYMKQKMEEIIGRNLNLEETKAEMIKVFIKECICFRLGNSFLIKKGIIKKGLVSACPGPNLAFFTEIVSFLRMVDHIYDRDNVISVDRPHIFINEAVEYLNYTVSHANRIPSMEKFKENFLNGLDFYKKWSSNLPLEERERFLKDLDNLRRVL